MPLAALFVFRGKRVAAVMLALLKAAAVVAAAVALDSVSECPGGESGGWTFRDGRCYVVSEGEHSFDDCNRVYCPSRAASDHVSAGTTSEETATLACWRDEATSDFLYEVGRGADEGMWAGLYQRRNKPVDKGWSKQSSAACDSDYENFADDEPNDWSISVRRQELSLSESRLEVTKHGSRRSR